ncbi:glycosyltransferase [Aureliella helgolandensis]|uniref:Glycosyl transferase family 2 n=1 Tax=Aureliella helgolandensis TaxID=2527968 RepID=A0A518G247_9BACT|nr:glycosyltransferase [Aureliella helgolandensis]QDV22697.1 Glycosyl transferase family 2 [Aureliella helgolandensis]
MLTGLSLGLAMLVGLSILTQLWGTSRFLRAIASYRAPVIEDRRLPQAAIVLSVRGCDTELRECLTRLAQQNYPRYSLHIIVDHPSDPARAAVQAWRDENALDNVHVEFLESPSPHAYLKTSAIRQCVAKLNSEIEIACLVDADTMVHANWLRDLAAPLAEGDAGIVTGNRWYAPLQSTWGGILRCQYNAYCVIPMYFLKIVWGGSLAMHRAVFDTPFFDQRMRDTCTEESAIRESATTQGLEIQCNPDVFLLNSTECSVAGCFQFVRRQLIWTRLYYPNWPHITLGVLGSYALLVATFWVMVCAAYHGNTPIALLDGAALLAQIGFAQGILELLHRRLSARVVERGGESFPPIGWRQRTTSLLMWPIFLTFLLLAVLSASCARRVRWRGISYQILPPSRIRMVNYQPWAEVSNQQSPPS